jgi:hypothetical protein
MLRSHRGEVPVLFFGGLSAGFVVFCAASKWQHYGSRLHIPLFILALAWAAVVLESLPRVGRSALLGPLTLAASPVGLLNYTRPLLTLPRGAVTPNPSIVSVPRDLQYFLYMPPLGRGYLDVSVRIADSGCTDVGVRAWPDAWE